jgi:hypothetical protein
LQRWRRKPAGLFGKGEIDLLPDMILEKVPMKGKGLVGIHI